jgi:hypothetical protein
MKDTCVGEHRHRVASHPTRARPLSKAPDICPQVARQTMGSHAEKDLESVKATNSTTSVIRVICATVAELVVLSTATGRKDVGDQRLVSISLPWDGVQVSEVDGS